MFKCSNRNNRTTAGLIEQQQRTVAGYEQQQQVSAWSTERRTEAGSLALAQGLIKQLKTYRSKIYTLSKRVVVLAFEKSATVEHLFSVVGITSQTIGSAATLR